MKPVVLYLLAALISVALAYSFQFTAATLSFGRELSDTKSGTGYQAAISPPWEANSSLVLYCLTLLLIVVAFWHNGLASGLGTILIMFVGLILARKVLPKPVGQHYRRLIIQSMMSRYANYVRDNDALRADAMKRLLVRAGFNHEVLQGP